MYRVSVMYPNQEGAKFDFEYYLHTHMELVKNHLKSFGLIKIGVERGLSDGGDQPAPYICIGSLYFEAANDYEKGIAAVGPMLRGDIQNFTDITPLRQISEILD